MSLTPLFILSIIFFATLVRSTFGFGGALVSVPLLIFFIPIEIAVPLCVLISFFIAAFIIVQDKKQVHFNSAKWLILFAALGIPFGLLLLIYGNESLTKLTLGLLLIVYSVYSLFSKNKFRLKTNHKYWLFLCGFFSGVLGGAYGFNGPPLVIYGNMSQWKAKDFRATLQAYFIIASLLGMFAFWYQGLWVWDVSYYFLISIPVIIPAILIGRYFNNRLKDDVFVKYIYLGLIVVGIIMLSQAF